MGRIPSHNPKASRSTGAVMKTGSDMKNRVMLTVVTSIQVPCFMAVKTPKGMPRDRATMEAARPSWADTQMRLPMSSATVRSRYL